MTWRRRLYPVGDPIILRPAYGNAVGAAPQLGDLSDATYITLTYLDGSGSTVIETQVQSLDDIPETVGHTPTDYQTVHRVAWSGPPATFDGDVPVLTVGPPNVSLGPYSALPGWSYPPGIPGTIYTLGPNSTTGPIPPDTESILRDPNPWVRLRPAGLLSGGIGDFCTYYEFWIEVVFSGVDPIQQLTPARLVYPRTDSVGPANGRLYPPPNTQQAGSRFGSSSPL